MGSTRGAKTVGKERWQELLPPARKRQLDATGGNNYWRREPAAISASNNWQGNSPKRHYVGTTAARSGGDRWQQQPETTGGSNNWQQNLAAKAGQDKRRTQPHSSTTAAGSGNWRQLVAINGCKHTAPSGRSKQLRNTKRLPPPNRIPIATAAATGSRQTEGSRWESPTLPLAGKMLV